LLIGNSSPMDEVRRLIAKAARHPHLPVLLLGETGTGKEVVARAIHDANPRGQFVPIDCGSLVGTLVESELFGHVKGAFSGAAGDKKGLVELADGGTAFFDEIGDLPSEMQVKLLRLLQEREFRAVGAGHWRKLDIRVIAATHRDLKAEIAKGRFREDLYYRLNVFPIRLPPLRDRREDIPLLLDHFLDGRPFGQDVLELLLSYDWPGNVRELKHTAERISVLTDPSLALPSGLHNRLAAQGIGRLSAAVSDTALATERLAPKCPVISISEGEKQAISAALASTNGERVEAARRLGIGRTTLYRKMKQYGIG
jgi:DNA-binding NtrC family response regulator